MFCNGPKMDGDDTTRSGSTTIIEMMIPRCQSSLFISLDDSRGLAEPIKNHSASHTDILNELIPATKNIVQRHQLYNGKILGEGRRATRQKYTRSTGNGYVIRRRLVVWASKISTPLTWRC